MPTPRSQQIDLSVTPYYHCMARCVRRAFLCGDDPVSGQNFDHRKGWIKDRLVFLSSIFTIDICAYAVMSNHLHVVLRVASEEARALPPSAVIERYTKLYPMAQTTIDAHKNKEDRHRVVELWRERLSNLSWMMRALNESIARRANKEEGLSGRFWEGRFKSQPILDETGLFACMAYVDLNPMRAGLCSELEEADFTSIQDRLRELSRFRQHRRKQEAPAHLASFAEVDCKTAKRFHLPISWNDYLDLLRWTAKGIIDPQKHCSTPVRGIPRVLHLRGVSPEGWLATQRVHRIESVAFVGSMESLQELADKRGQQWVQGLGLARGLAAR